MTSQDKAVILTALLIPIKNTQSPFDKLNIMKAQNLTVSQENASVILKKLLELKITLSPKSQSAVEDREFSVKPSKSSTYLLEELPTDTELDCSQNPLERMQQIRSQIIGLRTVFKSPFGFNSQAVYADHTATNRSYASVEKLITFSKYLAANPHTEFNHFGKYSTYMMEYSQRSILTSFEAKHEDFVALPTGSGSTGAIQKTLKILRLLKNAERPTVYLTPYQHHSNILPWIEEYENIKVLPSNQQGGLIYEQIEETLINDESQTLLISISAASNVTSILTNLETINKIIKKVRMIKKVYFCVDCAAYCSHKQFSFKKYCQADFVFLSPHKNLGGTESCGVLIGRKAIIELSKPTFPGGGTVKFVKGYKKSDIMYEDSIFSRQISGTPSFLGFYRAALSFQLLKNDIAYDFIAQNEKKNINIFLSRIDALNHKFKQQKKDSFIVVYGNRNFQQRGNIITFNILRKGQLISHNLISLILSDLFGIQIRSGCFCAGPFGIKLLNLSEQTIHELESQVSLGILKNKPGYCRLDLAFYFQNFEIDYISKALEMICSYGDKLGLFYTLCTDGQIQRLSILKEEAPIFGLANFTEIEQKNKLSSDKKTPREQKLKQQLQRAEDFLKNPIKFLKTLKK